MLYLGVRQQRAILLKHFPYIADNYDISAISFDVDFRKVVEQMLNKDKSLAKKRYKRHIGRKIFFWFLVVNILVMTVAAFWIYVTMKDRLIDDTFEELWAIRELSKDRFLAHIHTHIDIAQAIAKTPLIADVLLGNTSAEKGSKYLGKIRSIYREGDKFKEVYSKKFKEFLVEKKENKK